MENNLELRKVRDFGELVNDSFVFVKQNWKPLLKAFFTICGFFLVASAITAILYHLKLFNGSNSGDVFSPKKAFGIEYFATMFFGFLSYLSVALTTFSYINVYRDKGNQTPTVEEVWGHFKYYFWRYLGSQVVLAILFMVGFVFCFFPGVYLFPVITIITTIIIFENSGLGYAFDRGFKLIKQNWWTTFGALFVMMMAMYILMMIVVLPIGIISGAGLFLGMTKLPLPLLILTSVLQVACQAFMMIPYITASLCYFSLVEKKEGTSLLDKINMIGRDDSNDGHPEEQY